MQRVSEQKLHLPPPDPPDAPPLLAPATKNIFPESPRPPFLTEEVRKDCWKDLQNLLVKITCIYIDCAYTYSDSTKQNIQYLWCMFFVVKPTLMQKFTIRGKSEVSTLCL